MPSTATSPATDPSGSSVRCRAKNPERCWKHGQGVSASVVVPGDAGSLSDAVEALLDTWTPSVPKPRRKRSYRLVGSDSEVVERKVARSSLETVCCRSCSGPFSFKMLMEFWEGSEMETVCPCGESVSWAFVDASTPPYEVRIHPGEVRFLEDEAAVLSSSWFHATSSENWHEDVARAGVFVHLGSAESALARFSTEDSPWRERDFVMHEVRFKPGVKVDSRVFADQNDWAELVNVDAMPLDASRYPHSSSAVNRYVNEWEAPGHVSLLVNPDLFEVVGSTPLESKEPRLSNG